MNKMFSLSGKTALVTGSSRGIGKAIALAFAEAGAKVLLHGATDSAPLQATVQEFTDRGFCVEKVVADLTQAEQVQGLVEAVSAPVDILVLNASVQQYMSIESFDAAEFDREMSANVRSSFLLLKGFLPGMKERKSGRIIGVGSVNQMRPAARLAVYSTTKAAMSNLLQMAAKEYAAYGITVNEIVPGVISTDRNAVALADEERANTLRKLIPAHRFGEPSDCAGACVLLASEAGSYITGTEIVIDGGFALA